MSKPPTALRYVERPLGVPSDRHPGRHGRFPPLISQSEMCIADPEWPEVRLWEVLIKRLHRVIPIKIVRR